MAKKPAKKEQQEDDTQLNPKRELFCRYFTQNDELFGNATLSYAEAYGYKLDELPDDDEVRDEDGKVIEPSSYAKAYNVCGVEGRRLLKSPKVQERITALLNELLRDEVVDSQLAKVIMQDGKPEAKVAAIKEYNKLRARIIERSQTTIRTEKLDMDDLRALISVLPQERQDEFYATINAILAEAEELRRSGAKV